MNLAKIVLLFNRKGGVGKSTLASMIASYLEQKEKKVLVLNLALGQAAAAVNEAETVDFTDVLASNSGVTPSQVIAEIMSDYDYIVLDTAGEVSEELLDVINNVDYYILPYEGGSRNRIDAITYLTSIFSSGVLERKEIKMTLVHNKYSPKKNDKFLLNANALKDELEKLEEEHDIIIDKKFFKLSRSDAVETMEDSKASIQTLSNSATGIAYRIFCNRVNEVAEKFIAHENGEQIKDELQLIEEKARG